MRNASFLFFLLCSIAASGQGSSCSTPHGLVADAQVRNYTISSVTGTALHCTDPLFAGTGHVTIFSFTTNAAASCMLIDLTTSGNQPAEAILYTKCSGGGALQNPEFGSSVCFTDGTGLWAPSETLVLESSKVYFLRVWTPGTGTISLSAQHYDPPNNNCPGATPIGGTPISDNNACHKPGPGVTPPDLCAFSLENTAFYSYIVDVTGVSVLQISDIVCDNSAAGAVAGFQIGFFTGPCGALTPINCYAATGGIVNAPTAIMDAGTQVIVAIDGMSGSNCTYKISAFNGVVLPVVLKYFTAWMKPDGNLLRWITLSELGATSYDIEKSGDGIHFHDIGNVQGSQITGSNTYSYEDRSPWPDQFYRLRITGTSGKPMYSNIIHIKRQESGNDPVIIQYPVLDKLQLNVNAPDSKDMSLQVVDLTGRVIRSQNTRVNKGQNKCTVDVTGLAKGVYYLSIAGLGPRKGYSFIKQ